MADAPENSTPAPAPGPRSEEEILADPQLRETLAGYQSLYHDLFLKSYARELTDLHRNGDGYESSLEYLLHQHDKAARKFLWTIQHQKLFDLECQWRAELVDVPGARITADFEDWHQCIEQCGAVPAVSADELALLDAFLGQLTTADDVEMDNPTRAFWQQRRYPNLHPDDDDEEPLTPWTEFWDLHRGSGYLRTLPDLRGAKEFRYEQAAHDEHRRARPHTPPPADPRPQLPTWGPAYDDLVRGLLRRFEPAARLRQFETKRQLEAYDATEDRNELPLALERLQNTGLGLVPIEAHADWRQAIIAASNRYYLGQLRAALPHVYEEYSQREALGISHAPANENRYRRRRDTFTWHADLIREGRRLLGEPDDLNF